MKALLVVLALSAVQSNTLQDKPVIHLQPHQRYIQVEDGKTVHISSNGSAYSLKP